MTYKKNNNNQGFWAGFNSLFSAASGTQMDIGTVEERMKNRWNNIGDRLKASMEKYDRESKEKDECIVGNLEEIDFEKKILTFKVENLDSYTLFAGKYIIFKKK